MVMRVVIHTVMKFAVVLQGHMYLMKYGDTVVA
jgi:hypothetical protein